MIQSKDKLIIAIDGYSSCGKSTVAKSLARTLNYTYIDSGAMYRAVTLFCIEHGLFSNGELDESLIAENISGITIGFELNDDLGEQRIVLNGEIVEDRIRSLAVSNLVSSVSKVAIVREKMVEVQRGFGTDGGVVMDGRDIGSVVFPNADIKIFMTADPAIRARRRYDELVKKGENVSLFEVRKNIDDRDFQDQNREVSPLTQTDDAIVLDNSYMNLQEQLNWIIDLVTEYKSGRDEH